MFSASQEFCALSDFLTLQWQASMYILGCNVIVHNKVVLIIMWKKNDNMWLNIFL